MDKQEAFEFLELKPTATEAEIKKRLDEKLQYFEQLSAIAPGEFLQKLHQRNVDKVHAIRQMFFPGSSYAKQPAVDRPVQQRPPAYSQSPQPHYAQPANVHPVAWLIRHTEEQSARPFPLYEGHNHIGREAVQNMHNISLENDPYISRFHAIVEVSGSGLPSISVYDAGHLTGKASKNGVFVNGNDQRIVSKVPLKENDTIQVGVTKLVLRLNREKPVNNIVEEVSKTEYIKTVVIDLF